MPTLLRGNQWLKQGSTSVRERRVAAFDATWIAVEIRQDDQMRLANNFGLCGADARRCSERSSAKTPQLQPQSRLRRVRGFFWQIRYIGLREGGASIPQTCARQSN